MNPKAADADEEANDADHHTCIPEDFSSCEQGERADDEGNVENNLSGVEAVFPAGDHRALYLAWLRCRQQGEVKANHLAPPVPPMLERLTGPLAAFVDFLRLDPNLIVQAAQSSAAS